MFTVKDVTTAIKRPKALMFIVFMLNAISPYATVLKVLFNPFICTGTAPTH